jgi:hypothetical protein
MVAPSIYVNYELSGERGVDQTKSGTAVHPASVPASS